MFKQETTMKYTIQQFQDAVLAFDELEDFHTVGTETGVFLAYKGERLSGAYENVFKAMKDAIENTEEIIEYHESTKWFYENQTKPQPKKKKSLKFPGYLCMQLVVKPERKVVLSYFGNKVSYKEAKGIIEFLFSLSGSRYRKPLGHWYGKEDIYPNIKKLIADGSLTIEQAKEICLNHCSEYVWNTEIAS